MELAIRKSREKKEENTLVVLKNGRTNFQCVAPEMALCLK